MAPETARAAKRKSTDSTDQMLKKVKVAKSAERPTPAKSSLKKDKKAIAIVPEPVDASDDDDEAGDATLTAGQTAALLAGFSSSDEDEDEDEGIALDKLPKPPATEELQALTTTNGAAGAKDDERTPGVVYIGRLPHGFYERQMRAYFSQFGTVTHLKMGRNKKTGRSKHYAFIEFASTSVADIVAKTMDKYLLFNHILRVQRVARENVKEGMWKGEGKRKRPMPINKIEGAQLRRGTNATGWDKKADKENQRRKASVKKLKDIGYDFTMPTVKSASALPALPVLDTPTLEKGAELQLLEDVQHAADEQSSEVALQPDNVEPVTKGTKRTKTSESSKPTKKSKSKK